MKSIREDEYQDQSGMYVITEEPFISSHFKILKEEYNPNSGRIYAMCEAIFQTVDEVNRNRRKYPSDLISEALVMNMDKIKNRQFLGELDHPIDPNPIRQATVMYKSASHVISNLQLHGNNLVGVFETLSTSNGRDLFGLIKDRVPIGFSLRALGELMEEDGYTVVTRPFVMVAYDSVSQPSHGTARVTKILKEQIVCIGDHCYRQAVNSALDKRIKKLFKI